MAPKKYFKSKKAMELEVLGYWILGLVALVLIIIAIVALSGKGKSIAEYLTKLFRFGG